MKKVIFILLLFTNSIYSQSFCEDFNSYLATPLAGGGCSGSPQFNVLNNWGATNVDGINYKDTGSINGTGDMYLHADDGGCGNGSTHIYNNVDYSGNWIDKVPEEGGCFCFDIRLFSQNAGTYNGNTLYIMDGNDPSSSTISARFVLSIPVDVSRGWIRVCAPITYSDGVNLPSNANGQWVINTGGAAAWDSLITNVRAIGFSIDLGSGDEKFGYDNICISKTCDGTLIINPPTEEGDYCCEGENNNNLVVNGNFEFGNTGFSSYYTQTSTTYPGEYNVTTTAAVFGANVTDHSFCANPVAYATNDKFLVVNGKTQQSGSDIIWEQNVTGLIKGKEYKMCANFKDMEQCTFNILPKITLHAGTSTVTQIINTDDSNPCDWQRVEICFKAQSTSISLSIELNESGNGDGNDIAIDDIALQQKLDPGYFITVQHQGNNNTITGSLNTMSTGDDILFNGECKFRNNYYWFVYETTTPTAPLFSGGIVSGSFGWASNSTGGGPANSPVTPWSLTTNFSTYNTFGQNKFYIVGMYIPSCCASCYTEKWMYQVVYNSNNFMMAEEEQSYTEFTEEIQDYFIRRFVRGNETSEMGDVNQEVEVYGKNSTINSIEKDIQLYPNPASKSLHISLDKQKISSIEIFSITGQTVYTKKGNDKINEKEIDISNFPKGIYMVKIMGENQQLYNTKFVKK